MSRAASRPFLESFGEHSASSLLAAALGPGIRSASYAANQQQPNVLPSPGAVFNAWIGGYIDGDAGNKLVSEYLSYLGINMGQFGKLIAGDAVNVGGSLWPAVLYSSLVKPSPGEWISAWLRGHIKTSVAVEHERKLGTDKPMFRAIQNAYRLWPGVLDLAQLLNRDILTPDEYREYMQHAGGFTEPVIDYYQELTKLVPGPSDLVRFAVRESFSPQIAGPLGYYDEYPESISKYLKWQGLGWPLGFDVPTKGGNIPATWGHMYWAAHWQTLSPSQIYRLHQLFRPDRLQRYRDRGFRVDEFGIDKVRTWLKVNDYPESVRDWLAAASYLPMRLIDIRNGYLQKIRGDNTKDWAREQLLDRGNHPEDVEDTLELWRVQATGNGPAEEVKREKSRREACRKKLETRTLSMLRNGIIAPETAADRLTDLGWQAETATNCIAEAELSRLEKLIMAVVSRLRREFMLGQYDAIEIIDKLKIAGISPNAAEDYAATWAMELSLVRKQLSTDKILRLLRKGIIQPGAATERLRKIGWSAPDRIVMLEEVEQLITERQAKEQQAFAKSRASQAKAFERLIKENERITLRSQARLKQLTPVKTVLSWLKEGNISELWARNRLSAMGYPAEEIELYVRETLGEIPNGKQQSEQSAP